MDSVIIRGFKEVLCSMAFALALLLISGPFSVTQAAVTRIGTWTQVNNNTTANPATGTLTAGASASGKRALVVAISFDWATTQATGATTAAVSYGGQPMTSASWVCANATGGRCSGLFYLLDAGIAAAGNSTTSINITGTGGAGYNFVSYGATFDNVSQTNTIADFSTNSSVATSVTTLNFGKNVAVGIGDQLLYIRTVDTTSTFTLPTNFTHVLTDSAAAHSSVVGQRTVPVTDLSENISVVGTGNQISTMSVAVLNEYRVNTLTSCAGCHGYPSPLVDSGTRDPATGTFVGDHAKHNYDCTTCHGTLPGAYGHRDGAISFNSGTIGVTDNGTYTSGASVPQSNAPSPGSCDNVNCHGNNNTGTWGGAGYASCATSTCHGFPPATNAHTKHYTSKGWGTGSYANCVACHPDDFAAHTDRTDGVVTLANLTKAGSGTTITCSSIAATGCHNSAASTPTWGSTGITCSNCHTVDGANSATVANPVSGLHSNTVASVQDHDNTLAGGCEACHVKASITGHWDGNASATADYTKAAVGITAAMYTDASGVAATRGSCLSNTALATCHSDNGEWRRLWSTDADADITVSKLPGQAVCNVCHGQYNTLASSTGWNEGTGHYRSGSGAAENKGIIHADAGDECDDCHAYDSAAVHNSNNKIDFSGGGTTFTLAWGNNATNPGWYCNSGSCHAQTGDDASSTSTHTFFDSLAFPSPTRATPEKIAYVTGASTPQGSCFGCHGDGVAKYWPEVVGTDDGATTEKRAGAHELHMAWLANKVYGQTVTSLLGDVATDTKQRALCQYCHDIADGDHMSATVADVFVSAPKRFQDGVAEIAPLGSFETTGNTCSNVDCHAQYGTAAAGSEPVATSDWYITPTHTVLPGSSPTTMNCAACHNNPTADTKHTAHTGANTTFGISITCARCHSNGPVWGIPTGTLPSANHLDGTFNIAGTATLTYGGTFRTSFGGCGTNLCHNNGTSTTAGTPNTSGYLWGNSITNCTECHLGAMTSNAHLEHSTASGYTAAPCTECHALETATTHIDSNINFNTSKATYSSATAGVVTGLRANASQTGTCLTSGCHNKAAAQSAAWNTTGLLACNACHGDATSGLSTSHANHITATKTCAQCHDTAPTDATHISVKTTLIDGANAATGEANVTFVNAAAVTDYTYNSTLHTCSGATNSGLGCHATGAPDWDVSFLSTACTNCHTDTTTAAVNPTRGLHKAGTLTSSTPHDDSFATGGTCTTCHTAVPAAGGVHMNGTFTADEATATNEYYTLATMYTDAAANSGTCSGATAGAAGCHDSIFDAGSWARKWSATAYNTDGTQCAVCHGGFNNDWTFGSAANTTDFAVSHTFDWNTDATSNELIGNHSDGVANATKCDTCHVYADAPYSLTWGTGNHGNNLITMNSTMGYSDTNKGCTTTCHTTNPTGHTMESSANATWAIRGQSIAGPPLACGECHNGGVTTSTASGAHTIHNATNADLTGNSGADCVNCHGAAAGTYTSALSGAHGDGSVTFAAVTYSAVRGVLTGTCLTANCHNVNTKALQSTAWNTTQLDCDDCHFYAVGATTKAANEAAGRPLSATHSDHFDGGKTCTQCHGVMPVAGDTAHITTRTSLADMAVAVVADNASVAWTDASAVTDYTFENVGNTCSSATNNGLGCHATGTADWDLTIAATACTACHTDTTTAAVNPTSGLHKAGTLTSSTPHDDAFATGGTCTTCHTAVPALGGTHINGTFTINEATATNEYYTLATMYTDAAANSGTCSGATAGAAGCHDSIFDAGSWARKWSATAYNTDGTQCAVCHGGFNNDWTFGSAANTTDFAVSHTYDWNGDATSNELVGNHLNNTGNTTKCNICHVYADTPYSLTWGTGTHGNDKIAMNTMGGANTYSATTWTCNNTCHTEGGSHAMEASASSGTRVENIAGPALTCASCHSGYTTHIDADGAGATYTSGNCTDCHAKHADATAAGANVIYVPTVYGANIAIPTMNANYSSHGYKIRLGGNATIGACNTKSTEAEWCWACHDAQTPTKISEWRDNNKAKTGSKAYDYGDLYTDVTTIPGTVTSNWTTGFWRSGKGLNSTLTTNPYWYKRGKIRSTHSANYDAAAATPAAAEGTNWKAGLVATVAAGFSTAYNWGETLDAVANIRCSYCHDVHGTHNNGSTDVVGTPDAPYLRGTWTGNAYNEDGAPRYGMANFTNQSVTASTVFNYAFVPRASANPTNSGITGLAVGGYWIDQNSGNPNGTLPADSAATRLAKADASSGLCEMCHGANKNGVWTQAAIGGLDLKTGEALWVSGLNGHANSVIGAPGAASTAANIFNRTKRNGSAGPVSLSLQVNQVAVDMGLQNMLSGYGLSYRSASGAGSGYGWIPRVGQSTETAVTGTRAYAYEYFAWNTTLNTATTRTSTYATNTMSLDVTNPTPVATETAHNSQTNYHTFTCSKCHNPHASRLPKLMITNCLDTNHNTWEDKSTFTGTALTGVWAGLRHSQWASAQNCHRLDARATNSTSVTTLGTGWTKVTPWQEDTTPNGTLTGDITTQTAY